MAATKVWTLEELHALPDDRNTYELVHGELFVTPAPGSDHGTIVARLTRVLVPYVIAHDLGEVYHPREVIQHDGSQVEPDLMVRETGDPDLPRDRMPVPILVVEILSPSTARRDRGKKRDFYLELGVPNYWIVDPESRTVTSVRRAERDVVANAQLAWQPAGAAAPLVIELAMVFGSERRGR